MSGRPKKGVAPRVGRRDICHFRRRAGLLLGSLSMAVGLEELAKVAVWRYLACGHEEMEGAGWRAQGKHQAESAEGQLLCPHL